MAKRSTSGASKAPSKNNKKSSAPARGARQEEARRRGEVRGVLYIAAGILLGVYLFVSGTGVLGDSKVYIEIDGKFAISMINLAHYSDEPLDEQAAWFEVAIKEDGEMLESPDGGEALFQVRYNHLKALFEAIKTSTGDITRMGLWTALYRLEAGVGFEEAKRAYKRAFGIREKSDKLIPETPEEIAYSQKYVYFFTQFNQTGDVKAKAKAEFLLDKLRLMISQRLAHQG